VSDPLEAGPDALPETRRQLRRRPLATVLYGKLRACWHIFRGRRVIYGMGITDGSFTEHGWRTDLVFVDCRYVAEFTVNGIPALELRTRSGDVMVQRKRRRSVGTSR
jgi:hypothetical protein